MKVKIGCKVKLPWDDRYHVGWVVHHDGMWEDASPWWVMYLTDPEGDFRYDCFRPEALKVLAEPDSAESLGATMREAFGGKIPEGNIVRAMYQFGKCHEELVDND